MLFRSFALVVGADLVDFAAVAFLAVVVLVVFFAVDFVVAINFSPVTAYISEPLFTK